MYRLVLTYSFSRVVVCTCVSEHAFSVCCTCVTLRRALAGLEWGKGVSEERRTTAGQGDVDGTGCVVQYEHPLCSDRCSFVKLPADLNGALLLKHREAISSGTAHLQGGVPGGWEPPWVICRLRGLFLKKSRQRVKLKTDLYCSCSIVSYWGTFMYLFFYSE